VPRATWIQASFNAGEWSPQLYGRIDLPKRKSAMSSCLNFVPLLQGPLTRRPGTQYIAGVKGDATSLRLIPFMFNVVQAYVLEFTANAIRFYTNGGQLLSTGVPYEVATSYTDAELVDLSYTQSADVLYLVHPNHPPATLSRLGATNWVLANLVFQDGPYLDRNVSANTMSTTDSAPGTTGVTLAVSTGDGVNNGVGFLTSDVGRLVRVLNRTTGATQLFSIYKITSVTNPLVAIATCLALH
jgi:hypothetical protein